MIITLFSNLLSSHLCNKVEPLLAHLHPGDALSRQVRVDGGELATDGEVVDDFLEGRPQILGAVNAFVPKNIVDCIFLLVASCWAVSAVFQDLEKNIGVHLPSLQGFISHEKKCLRRKWIKEAVGWSPD